MSEETILEKLVERIENKLDCISKDLNEFKNGVTVSMNSLTNRVENTENKVKNIENSMNKPLKDRFLDMCINGLTYSFSACIGIGAFILVFKATGSSIFTMLKPILSAIIGV